MQELKILNQFEKFGRQEKAIDFAKTLNQFDRGVINFVKNSKGQWVRAPKPGLGGYEFAKGGQQIELTKIRKVYDLDEIMPSDAQVDFGNAGPELGELEAPPHPSFDAENLELTDLTEEVVEQEAQEILTGLEKFTPLAEEALIEAETAEDTIILARQIAITAAEAAAEVTEITVAGVLGSLVTGVLSAAIMLGMTLAGNYLLRWIRAHHMDHLKDDDPIQGAIGWLLIKKMWYPMYIDLVDGGGKKKKEKWSIYFRDLTKYWRPFVVKAYDERVQVLKPIQKWGSENLLPKMYIHDKIVEVPFYKEFTVGTRIKRVDKTIVFIGKLPQFGTITRKMIFRNYNIHGYESVGQYRDRYKVKLDNGVTIYLPVYKFQVYAQNFKPKTRPHHGRPIVVGEKGKKKRKDEIIAWKKIRKDLRVHLEVEEDKKRADRERYER